MSFKPRKIPWRKTLPVFAVLGIAVMTGCPQLRVGETPTVTGVRIEAESHIVVRGETVTLTATVDGTYRPPQSVNWYIVNPDRNPGTRIDANGVLHIAAGEILEAITIGARSAFDPRRSGHLTLSLYGGSAVVTGVTIHPPDEDAFAFRGGNLTLTAWVTGYGDISQDVRWQIVQTPTEQHPGTELDGDVYDNEITLLVATDDPRSGITVRATSVMDEAFWTNVVVSVHTREFDILDVTVEPAEVDVARGDTVFFAAAVDYAERPLARAVPELGVTWYIVDGNTHDDTVINRFTGEFTVSRHEAGTPRTITVMARSVADSSVTGLATVRVAAPAITDVTIDQPAPAEVERGAPPVRFTATVHGTGYPPQDVDWSVTAPGSIQGTGIDSAGYLTVAANQPYPLTITVEATARNTGVQGTHVVTVPAPRVTSVTIQDPPHTIEAGETLGFTAVVIGTGNPNQGVTWNIDAPGKHANTFIDSATGYLTVYGNETPELRITVTATSVQDTSMQTSHDVIVVAPLVVGIIVNPSSPTVLRGDSRQFTAAFEDGGGTATVTWDILEGTISPSAGTGITSGGLLTVSPNQSAPGTLTVRATYTGNPNWFGTATVHVPAPTVDLVTIVSPPVSLSRGAIHTFTATVSGTGNHVTTVTWHVEGAGGTVLHNDTGINNNGVLTVSNAQALGSLLVRAISIANPDVEGTAVITVPQGTANNVAVYPAPPGTATVPRGASGEFIAVVTGPGYPDMDVTWDVEAGSVAPHQNTVISTAGILSVAQGQNPGTLTVRATSAVTLGVSGTVSVTVPAPTATTVTVTRPAETVRRGDTTDAFTVAVTGPGYPSNAVTWTVEGNGVELHQDTGMVDGTLYVSRDQEPGTLTVLATSVHQATPTIGNRVGETSIEVLPPTATHITIDPTEASVPRTSAGVTVAFTAAVTGEGYPPQTFTWTVEPWSGGELHPSTLITGTGVLTVPGGETNNVIRVVATSDVNTQLSIHVDVNIVGDIVRGDWRHIRVGVDHTTAITWYDELFTWGSNSQGQLGRGGALGSNSPIPVQIGTREDWDYVTGGWGHSIGLRNGAIYGWGRIFHQIWGTPGPNNENLVVTYGTAPVQIGSDTNWTHISAGHSNAFAIREDGSLWAWGRNNDGVLGVGGTNNQPVPERVGNQNHWASVSGSPHHTVALTVAGHMYVWGSNDVGQLGPGAASLTPRRLQVVGGGDDTRQWRMAAAGGNIRNESAFTVAICPEGYMYTWGTNGDGSLAATEARNIPTRITMADGIDRRWMSMQLNTTVHVVAIDVDNNLWTWGNNSHGQLGNGEIGGISATPTMVTAPYTSNVWVSSVAGGSFTLAIQVDGTLWAWGHNQHGMLGTGSVGTGTGAPLLNNYPLPVRVFRDGPGDG